MRICKVLQCHVSKRKAFICEVEDVYRWQKDCFKDTLLHCELNAWNVMKNIQSFVLLLQKMCCVFKTHCTLGFRTPPLPKKPQQQQTQQQTNKPNPKHINYNPWFNY